MPYHRACSALRLTTTVALARKLHPLVWGRKNLEEACLLENLAGIFS